MSLVLQFLLTFCGLAFVLPALASRRSASGAKPFVRRQNDAKLLLCGVAYVLFDRIQVFLFMFFLVFDVEVVLKPKPEFSRVAKKFG
jgi:hypothetical protein